MLFSGCKSVGYCFLLLACAAAGSAYVDEPFVLSGAHIRKKFGGVSYVLGPTFVVFVFGKNYKSQLYFKAHRRFDGDSTPRV